MSAASLVLVSDRQSELLIALSSRLGVNPTIVPIEHFADTESYIPFKATTTFDKADVLVVFHFFQTSSQQSINERMFQLLILIDFLATHGARNVNLFLPYLPYGRQNLDYYEKKRGPLNVVYSTLKAAGVHHIFSVDLHDSEALDLFGGSLKSFSLQNFWADTLKKECADNLDNLIVVSPDEGGLERARDVADLLDVPVCHIEKERIAPDTSSALQLVGVVSGKDVVILDDILGTASTAVAAVDLLVEQGARSIIGCFTHGVFCDDAHARIKSSQIAKVYSTDTILNGTGEVYDKERVVSCADFLSTVVGEEFHESAE